VAEDRVRLYLEFTMTDAARRDESDSNLSAFRLGVFANEFLWNLDQAVVADSEPHRRVALGLVQRLGAIGAIFTGMRTDAPLQDFLKGAREHLPDRMTGNYSVWFSDLLLAGEEDGDDINAGELWYSNFGVRSEREKLLKVIVDSTLSTTQQRQWFLLGLLIDSGRHPPDTGSHLYKFNPPRDRRHVVPVNSQSIVTNDDEDEDEPELPPLRVLEPGELRPGRDWWREVVGLSEQLKVPCNFVEPDLSTASSIVETVEQMIASARTTIKANAPAPLISLSDGHQQPASGLPTVGTAHKDPEVSPLAGGGTDVLNGNSTEQRDEEVEVSQSDEMMDPTIVPKPPDENQPQNTSTSIPESTSAGDSKENPNQVQGTRFGRWTIYKYHVQFDGLPPLNMTWSYRKIFQCLLEHRHNPVDQAHLIEVGWGPNSQRSKTNLIPLISILGKQLRNYLKETLGDQLPQELILCPARGKDLCYQLNPAVR